MATHGHGHPPEHGRAAQRRLTIALIITSTVLVAEFLGGLYTNSLALLADAAHMLTDVAALGLSLFAIWFSAKPATPSKTYGFYRVEILAALVNGVALILIAVLIFYEAYERILNPPAIKAGWMLLVASAGFGANLLSAYLLFGQQHESLNVRGAFLHVMGDAAGSIGAIGASLAILLWSWNYADSIISSLVAVLILCSSWILIRDAVDVLLEGTPSHINIVALKEQLARVDGVHSVHDLHVWTLTSGVLAMSCHVVIDRAQANHHHVLNGLNNIVRERFRIGHTTIQIEGENLQRQESHSCN